MLAGARAWGSCVLLAFACGAGACAERAGAAERAPASHLVFLDFSDGTHGVTAGAEDDAAHDVSQLCGADRFARWEAPRACAGGDREACREEVLEGVRGYFAAYDVDFTLTRPEASAAFTTVVIAPPLAACTFGKRGVAFADCGDENPANVGMAFDCHGDAASCAVLVAHEAAHTFGLVHSRDPSDVMTPSPEDPHLAFLPTAAPTEANACGVTSQSSHASLLRALGPRRE
jgi:hypothetical protein